MNTTKLLLDIRCRHCGKILAELGCALFLIKCQRCNHWNIPEGAYMTRDEAERNLQKSIDNNPSNCANV